MDYSLIKRFCDEKGITLPEIAEKIGMSRAGIYSTIEHKTLKVETLEKISDVLSLPISLFFNENENENFIFNLSAEINSLKNQVKERDEKIDILNIQLAEKNKELKELTKNYSTLMKSLENNQAFLELYKSISFELDIYEVIQRNYDLWLSILPKERQDEIVEFNKRKKAPDLPIMDDFEFIPPTQEEIDLANRQIEDIENDPTLPKDKNEEKLFLEALKQAHIKNIRQRKR
mgnify:CR=1 FL=1